MKYSVIVCDDDEVLAKNLAKNIKYAVSNFTDDNPVLFGNPFRTAEPLERSVDGSVRQCATYASGCQFIQCHRWW